ncbi:chaperonin 10-like protein [Chaetomium fimeti]|uniref:Chaperonin 10-like protein n=1 Tax=Chaetomium fimeti TaxID=1854472 RepID=A0AAE0H8T2_9PEZI|nr:chaperonin 10-like protein [Chaetomium fimeti]
MAPPSEIKAVVVTKPETAEVKTVPLPTLPDDYILVRTTAVALNPTDWKHVYVGFNVVGAVVGCDYAGVVEQVGPKVTKPFVKGDRVCGMVHGSNTLRPEGGGFAEYVTAKGDLQIKIPDHLSDEDAATLGVGISTVGQGLYQALQLPLPGIAEAASASNPPPEILIYGGSTATGLLGIQFAKLSGSLGADAAFDYRSPAVVDEIKAWSADADALTLAWDCIAEGDAPRICAAALSRTRPGHYRALRKVEDETLAAVNDKVDNGTTLGYTILGEPINKGKLQPGIPEDYEHGKMFWELARGLLEQKKIKPAKADVNRGGKGLEGVLVGLEELRAGKVSGVKLVYTL